MKSGESGHTKRRYERRKARVSSFFVYTKAGTDKKGAEYAGAEIKQSESEPGTED